MKLETVDMPLFAYQSLTISQDVEECFKDISPPPKPLIPEMEIPGLGAGVENSIFHSAVPPPPFPQCRVGWELIS